MAGQTFTGRRAWRNNQEDDTKSAGQDAIVQAMAIVAAAGGLTEEQKAKALAAMGVKPIKVLDFLPNQVFPTEKPAFIEVVAYRTNADVSEGVTYRVVWDNERCTDIREGSNAFCHINALQFMEYVAKWDLPITKLPNWVETKIHKYSVTQYGTDPSRNGQAASVSVI